MATPAVTIDVATERFRLTVRVADYIRAKGTRFDKTWRWGTTPFKARFYERCCTFAANEMADDPLAVQRWAEFLIDGAGH